MIRISVLLLSALLVSCNQSKNTAKDDFIDRREFEFNVSLIAKEDSGAVDNMIQLFAKPDDSNESITLNLNVGPSGMIERVAALDSYLLLKVNGNDDEHRLYYRDIFSRSQELNGAELPVSRFKFTEHSGKVDGNP